MRRAILIALVAVAVAVAMSLVVRDSAVRAQPVATITLPPPGEPKELYPGCNSIALTFPDGTKSEAMVEAVTPAGLVQSLWRQNAAERRFEGYSPAAPEVSDLLTVDFLDAVWLCLAAAPSTSAATATQTPTQTPAASRTPSPRPTASSTATPIPPTPTRVPPSPTPTPSPTPVVETQPLRPPQELGPVQAGGKAEVTISNDSPHTLTVELVGPESRTITMPPCSTCSEYSIPPAYCPEKGPEEVVRLAPGHYSVTVRADEPDVPPLAGPWDLDGDTGYFSCFFIVTTFG